jgi:hypothetical protein
MYNLYSARVRLAKTQDRGGHCCEIAPKRCENNARRHAGERKDEHWNYRDWWERKDCNIETAREAKRQWRDNEENSCSDRSRIANDEAEHSGLQRRPNMGWIVCTIGK